MIDDAANAPDQQRTPPSAAAAAAAATAWGPSRLQRAAASATPHDSDLTENPLFSAGSAGDSACKPSPLPGFSYLYANDLYQQQQQLGGGGAATAAATPSVMKSTTPQALSAQSRQLSHAGAVSSVYGTPRGSRRTSVASAVTEYHDGCSDSGSDGGEQPFVAPPPAAAAAPSEAGGGGGSPSFQALAWPPAPALSVEQLGSLLCDSPAVSDAAMSPLTAVTSAAGLAAPGAAELVAGGDITPAATARSAMQDLSRYLLTSTPGPAPPSGGRGGRTMMRTPVAGTFKQQEEEEAVGSGDNGPEDSRLSLPVQSGQGSAALPLSRNLNRYLGGGSPASSDGGSGNGSSPSATPTSAPAAAAAAAAATAADQAQQVVPLSATAAPAAQHSAGSVSSSRNANCPALATAALQSAGVRSETPVGRRPAPLAASPDSCNVMPPQSPAAASFVRRALQAAATADVEHAAEDQANCGGDEAAGPAAAAANSSLLTAAADSANLDAAEQDAILATAAAAGEALDLMVQSAVTAAHESLAAEDGAARGASSPSASPSLRVMREGGAKQRRQGQQGDVEGEADDNGSLPDGDSDGREQQQQQQLEDVIAQAEKLLEAAFAEELQAALTAEVTGQASVPASPHLAAVATAAAATAMATPSTTTTNSSPGSPTAATQQQQSPSFRFQPPRGRQQVEEGVEGGLVKMGARSPLSKILAYAASLAVGTDAAGDTPLRPVQRRSPQLMRPAAAAAAGASAAASPAPRSAAASPPAAAATAATPVRTPGDPTNGSLPPSGAASGGPTPLRSSMVATAAVARALARVVQLSRDNMALSKQNIALNNQLSHFKTVHAEMQSALAAVSAEMTRVRGEQTALLEAAAAASASTAAATAAAAVKDQAPQPAPPAVSPADAAAVAAASAAAAAAQQQQLMAEYDALLRQRDAAVAQQEAALAAVQEKLAASQEQYRRIEAENKRLRCERGQAETAIHSEVMRLMGHVEEVDAERQALLQQAAEGEQLRLMLQLRAKECDALHESGRLVAAQLAASRQTVVELQASLASTVDRCTHLSAELAAAKVRRKNIVPKRDTCDCTFS